MRAHWSGDAVLFDLDGVLADSMDASERIWLRWAERRGVGRDVLLATVHNGSAHDSVAALAPSLDAEAESARLEAEQVEDTEGVVALPGARTLLDALPPGRWAVVTSTTSSAARPRRMASWPPLAASRRSRIGAWWSRTRRRVAAGLAAGRPCSASPPPTRRRSWGQRD